MSIINTAEIGKLKKNKLDKAGDTMTGALTLSGAPSSNLHATTKLYVDTQVASKDALSELSGDTDDVSEGSTNLYYTDARAEAVSINNVSEDTTPQLGGNLDFNGNTVHGVDSTEMAILDGATVTTTELNYLDITTLGTVEASKAVTSNANGDVRFPDNEKLLFGTGSDLQIYHDGSNSYIKENGTGNLRLSANNLLLRGDDTYVQSEDGSINAARFNNTTGVTLYRAGSTKLATTGTGIDVTGTVTADGLSVDDGNTIIDSGTATVSNTVTTVDSWATASFQSAKYTVTARGNGNKFQVSELLVFHDNANNAHVTEYGIMSSDGTPFVTYTVDVNAGSVRLRATLDAVWSGGDNVKYTRFAQANI